MSKKDAKIIFTDFILGSVVGFINPFNKVSIFENQLSIPIFGTFQP